MQLHPITFLPATTDEHFKGILKLQRENHYSMVGPEEQAQQGFVFATHDIGTLKKMALTVPQIVAIYEGNVVGYTLAMTASMESKIKELVPMFNEFKRCVYRGKLLTEYNYIVGGQVCVDKDHRGKGLLKRLYHELRNNTDPRYSICVTEISQRNSKSLGAHLNMGFEIIRTYEDEKEVWDIVAWQMRD